jgi:LasA protease
MSTNTLRLALVAALLSAAGSTHASTFVPDALRASAIDAFAVHQFLSLESMHPDDLLVEIIKQDDDQGYVMGAVTQPLPANVHGTPPTRFFFAHREGDSWSLAMPGDEHFLEQLAVMPAEIVGGEERRIWTARATGVGAAAAGSFTGIGLPWSVNGSWTMSAGIHGDVPSRRPYNAIDFWTWSGNVLAPRGGIYYRTCNLSGSALVHIIHDNNFDTTYYHMEDLAPIADSTVISTGTYLGRVGNALPCGGQTTGAHVHMALEYGARPVAVDNKVLGGWTFHEGQRPYEGNATRGSNTQWPGNNSKLVNFGETDRGL